MNISSLKFQRFLAILFAGTAMGLGYFCWQMFAGKPFDLYQASTLISNYLVRKNDLQRGQLAFEKFIEANAGDSRIGNAKFWLGRIHLQEGHNAQAAQYLLALIEEHPNHAKRPDALVDLAEVLLKLESAGDACNALSEFRRVDGKASSRLKARAGRIGASARCS